ncbi:hypothetical protein CsSME_00014891 [Camellia sinensis var. sinensis]
METIAMNRWRSLYWLQEGGRDPWLAESRVPELSNSETDDVVFIFKLRKSRKMGDVRRVPGGGVSRYASHFLLGTCLLH